jgi:hypothetical protein
MEGVPKERNIPPKENLGPKRFEIQSDSFVHERLDAVQNGVEEMKEEDPSVVGLTMYGSMVKGKAHEGSDIDGYLYLDAERLAQNEMEQALQENREPRPVTFDTGDAGNLSTYPGEHLYDVYKPLLNEKMTKDGSLTEEQVSDINLRPISGEIIDRHLGSLQQGLEMARNGEEGVNIEPSQNLYGLFHLEVGRGLGGYRQQVIEKLEGLGQEGEEIWSKIIGQTEKLEQYMYTDTPIRYPRTLAEARNTYMPKKESAGGDSSLEGGQSSTSLESWPEGATAEAYESYEEPFEVQMYNEQKQEYIDAIAQWDDYIEKATAEDGYELNEGELHRAFDMRERMIQEMVEVSGNYPGDWTGLLYKRAVDPITKEKFTKTRTEAMETMREGEVGKVDKPKQFKEHYQNQMDNYDRTVDAVFSRTKIGDGGIKSFTLGMSTGIGDTGIVYDGAHQKDGTPLTARQKNIIEAHEKGHGLRDFESTIDRNEIRSVIDPQALMELKSQKQESGDKNFRGNYTEEPAEVIERMAQFKNYFGMSANEKFTKKHLDHIRKHYVADTGLDNGVSDLLACVTPETEKAFLDVINKYPI